MKLTFLRSENSEFFSPFSISFFLFFFQIVPDGIAAKCGKLRMGDRILKVNGSDVTSATHQESVTELLRPADEIKLTVQHDPLPVGFQVSEFVSLRCVKTICEIEVS